MIVSLSHESQFKNFHTSIFEVKPGLVTNPVSFEKERGVFEEHKRRFLTDLDNAPWYKWRVLTLK
jgi:hypothetical protein